MDRNFQDWVFRKQAGNATNFNEEQMQWPLLIKDYVVNSVHINKDNFDLNHFNANGGLGKFYSLFKEDYEGILEELNEALAA